MQDASLETPSLVSVEPHAKRGGLALRFPAARLAISPRWHFGAFGVQFVQLPADQLLVLPEGSAPYLKVITGMIDSEPHRPFPPRGRVTSTRCATSRVTALQDSLLCVITDAEMAPSAPSDMAQLTFTGEFSEYLGWQSFHEKFAAVTDIFDGLDAHMVPGFHLLDAEESEIAYVHFWTTGPKVDVSTHNHAQPPSELAPAFAEVHLVLRNGTGTGGMYECERPGSPRHRTVIQAGEEHGPFFFTDAHGRPLLLDNGAVAYPWHGWQGGDTDTSTTRYDLVAAFEINPAHVRVI